MVQNDFVWRVELVSGFPVRVGHPQLLLLEVVLEVAVVPGNRQQVSVAEDEVSGGKRGLDGSDYLFIVFLDCTTGPRWHTVLSPGVLGHGRDWSIDIIGLTGAILGVLANVRSTITCYYRKLTCVTAMEHLDQLGVPFLIRAVVTV